MRYSMQQCKPLRHCVLVAWLVTLCCIHDGALNLNNSSRARGGQLSACGARLTNFAHLQKINQGISWQRMETKVYLNYLGVVCPNLMCNT
jgi:hypothetical protein